MSYILDALKRSEQERQRAELAVPVAVALETEPARRRGWVFFALALLVLINAAALTALFWPRAELEPATAPAAAPVTPTPAPTLAAMAGSERSEPMLARGAEQRRATAPAEAVRVDPASQNPPTPTEPSPRPASAGPAPAPPLSELPENFRRSLPPIPVSIHVYAEQPQARFVMVDMHRYGEGAQLSSGVTIEAITPNGLILTHRGQRFALTVR